MDNPTTPANNVASKASSRTKLDKTIARSILVLFLTACTITTTSHHMVNRDLKQNAEKDSALLSVPKPRIREAAKGGLPPIPDFVKKKTAEHHRHEIEAKVEQARKALEEAQAQLAVEIKQSTETSITADTMERSTRGTTGDTTKDDPNRTNVYPYPYETISPKSKVLLQPTFGSHRANKNAVFAFAEGYPLDVYVTFVESLKLTGFDGDVVFAVSSESEMKRDVADYLKSYSDSNVDGIQVISYSLPWECYRKNGARILSTNGKGTGSTTNNGFSDCQIHGIYSNEDGSPANDPRTARPVATARYEMYWIWSLQYEASSRILILDVRDSYFQSNPFVFFEQSATSDHECSLDLFEENREAVNIGKSSYNSKWVKTAYGNNIYETMSDKPVICSGSTMGGQKAIELYTRATVAQFDKNKCKQVGCDQGFHNFLYYDPSGVFNSELTKNKCKVNVHKQGEGAVNNLAAMRTSSLRSQGVLIDGNGSFEDGFAVVNSDKTLSPVVHQFDRDNELKGIIRNRTRLLVKKWAQSRNLGVKALR
ncbi:hypothetical protein ACHAXN_011417 [Cyclotella atomus]